MSFRTSFYEDGWAYYFQNPRKIPIRFFELDEWTLGYLDAREFDRVLRAGPRP
jgi:hypothetical protein